MGKLPPIDQSLREEALIYQEMLTVPDILYVVKGVIQGWSTRRAKESSGSEFWKTPSNRSLKIDWRI